MRLQLAIPVLMVFLFASFANADIVYWQFASSQGISGTINGANFSNASWDMELAIDDSVNDEEALSEQGTFSNAVVGGHLHLDGVVYELATSNFVTGTALLVDHATIGGNLNFVSGVLDGGWIEFVADNNTAIPNVFGDANDLSSWSNGTSGFNTITNDWGYAGNIRFTELTSSAGETIVIPDVDLSQGTTTITASDTSLYAVQVPEPTSSGLVLALLIGSLLRRRRKPTLTF